VKRLGPVYVASGGFLGAVFRWSVGVAVPGAAGTVVVNVVGSVVLGALVAAPLDGGVLLVLGAGFCGAFTTFSSFAVGVVERAQGDELIAAVRYATLMLVAALVGVGIGELLVHGLV
jgi:CrcB protein